MSNGVLGVEVCPVCGKEYVPAPQHVYKVKHRLVCSWGCLRKAEKEAEARKVKRVRGKREWL